VSLWHGEKRLVETDLVVNSSPEPLAFTRVYRQSKQADEGFQFMGLGWTHNHNITLVSLGETPEKLVVQLPSGGFAHFTYDDPSETYIGDPGSHSVIAYDSLLDQFTVTAEDKSLFTFIKPTVSAAIYRIEQRRWANGEKWTYSYKTGTEHLESVSDEYGRTLHFSYHETGDFEGQLETISDDLGRTVTFSYMLEQMNGSTASDPLPLLIGVSDPILE
jgi:hypothetical protein